MSETAAVQDATAPSLRPYPVWKAVLLRSMITLFFGLVTVFWAAPGTLGLCLSISLYLIALAAAQLWSLRVLQLPRTDPKRLLLQAAAGLMAVAGIVVLISVNTAVAAWLGALALALMGAAELFAALHGRAADAAAATHGSAAVVRASLRGDWLISGALGVGTGVLLPFFITTGEHALLGVAGGGALMTGSLWLLSALTLRHDGRKTKQK